MDGGVIATAQELFQCRHYPSVVAVITDALESEPECVDLLVIRARAHIKLRRDLDAQADLRDIIRIAPSCGVAYRLLGELAARRDENESAAIFFREALRLDPDDHEAAEWLLIVETSVRPAAVAKKLPAPAAAAGRFPITRAPVSRPNTATGANPRSLLSPARGSAPGAQPRYARGTPSPDAREESPTMARGSARRGDILWTTPAPEIVRDRTEDLGDIGASMRERTDDRGDIGPSMRDRTEDLGDIDPNIIVDPEGKTAPAPHSVFAEGSSPTAQRFDDRGLSTAQRFDDRGLSPAPRFDDRGSIPALPPPPNMAPLGAMPAGAYPVYDPAVHKRRRATTSDAPQLEGKTEPAPAPLPVPSTPSRRLSDSRPATRGPMPELPGFGDYLVDTGILTRERLRAAQAYQRSMKVQLATAIVTLGLATPQRIEWAAVAHQSQLARDRAAAAHH